MLLPITQQAVGDADGSVTGEKLRAVADRVRAAIVQRHVAQADHGRGEYYIIGGEAPPGAGHLAGDHGREGDGLRRGAQRQQLALYGQLGAEAGNKLDRDAGLDGQGGAGVDGAQDLEGL